MRNVPDKSFSENQKRILYSITFFYNRAIYEIVSKNSVEPGRSQMIIWRTHIACLTPRATNLHSEYVIRIPYSQQQWLYERVSLLHYTTLPVLSYYFLSKTHTTEIN
jgi:hypothetical protein